MCLYIIGVVPGDEVRLYCYSQMRAKKECAMSERFSNRFEKELEQLSDGLSRKGTVKRLDLIHHRVGRIQERSRGAAQHYQVTVTPNKRGDQAESVSWRFNPLPGTLQTNPGVYCLRSTETDWDESTLWRTQWHSFSKKSHSFNSSVFPQDLDDLQLINRSVFLGRSSSSVGIPEALIRTL